MLGWLKCFNFDFKKRFYFEVHPLIATLIHTLENSEDPDEMLHNAAFHQGLHCLHRQKQFSEKEIQFYLKIISVTTCYKQWMIPSLLYQTRRKNPLEHKRFSEAFVIFRINNCVGEANHHVFVLLLFYAMMFGLNTFVFLMLHFWVWPKCQLCDHVSISFKV